MVPDGGGGHHCPGLCGLMGREEGGTISRIVWADQVGVTALSWTVWADGRGEGGTASWIVWADRVGGSQHYPGLCGLMGREREGQHPGLCGLMGQEEGGTASWAVRADGGGCHSIILCCVG